MRGRGRRGPLSHVRSSASGSPCAQSVFACGLAAAGAPGSRSRQLVRRGIARQWDDERGTLWYEWPYSGPSEVAAGYQDHGHKP